jgi:hypothetical protein
VVSHSFFHRRFVRDWLRCRSKNFMKFKQQVALIVTFIGCACYAQPQLVYTAPSANARVGAAISQSVTQNLRSRGFAANDPRIAQTIKSISSRIPALSTAAGNAATWLRIGARLSPHVSLAVLLVQGVKWYLDGQGNVVAQGTAITLDGTTIGFNCFYVLGAAAGTCFGTPEQAFTHNIISTTVFIDLVSINLTADLFNSPAYNAGRRFSATGQGHRSDQSPTSVWAIPLKYIYAGTATITCPSGQGQVGGQCVPSQIDKYTPPATQPSTTAQSAYDALSPSAKSQALSPDFIADLANRHWRDAALQPNYVGVPWSAPQPVTTPQATPYQVQYPNDWPRVEDLNTVPPAVNSIASPETNPNAFSSPNTTTTVQVDFGQDPGTPTPTLEETPENLFEPIKALLNPFIDWQPPTNNAAACPTFSVAPSIGGHSLNVDMVEVVRQI